MGTSSKKIRAQRVEEGIEFCIEILHEKLRRYRNKSGDETFSAGDIINIYRTLKNETTTPNHIILTTGNQLNFLRTQFETRSEEHYALIESFLLAFIAAVRHDLLDSDTASPEAKQLLNIVE